MGPGEEDEDKVAELNKNDKVGRYCWGNVVCEQKDGDGYQPDIEDEGCVEAKFAVFAEEGANIGVLLQSGQVEAVGY